MNQTTHPLHPQRLLAPARTHLARLLASVCLIAATCLLGGCVYHIGIQQGNLITPKDLDQVKVGMTESQVRFLLGTPTINDTFHPDRWDYPYYTLQGRHSRVTKKDWFVVYFKDDKVVRIDRQPGEHEPESAADKKARKHAKINLGASKP